MIDDPTDVKMTNAPGNKCHLERGVELNSGEKAWGDTRIKKLLKPQKHMNILIKIIYSSSFQTF